MDFAFNYNFLNPIKKETLEMALSIWSAYLSETTEEQIGKISCGAKNLYKWNQSILKVYLLNGKEKYV